MGQQVCGDPGQKELKDKTGAATSPSNTRLFLANAPRIAGIHYPPMPLPLLLCIDSGPVQLLSITFQTFWRDLSLLLIRARLVLEDEAKHFLELQVMQSHRFLRHPYGTAANERLLLAKAACQFACPPPRPTIEDGAIKLTAVTPQPMSSGTKRAYSTHSTSGLHVVLYTTSTERDGAEPAASSNTALQQLRVQQARTDAKSLSHGSLEEERGDQADGINTDNQARSQKQYVREAVGQLAHHYKDRMPTRPHDREPPKTLASRQGNVMTMTVT